MLLRIFDRCQKWIVNYNRLVLFYLIILIIISLIIDEKNSFANCQELGSKNDLMTLNSAISSRQTIPEFFSNNPAFATLLATLPSKLIGLVILRYIKQQQMQNQFLPIGGFNGGNNCDGNGKGGKRGNNCNGNGNGNGFGNNGGNGNDDDDNRPERTLMFFAGNGNIQVKNHKGLVSHLVLNLSINFSLILLFFSEMMATMKKETTMTTIWKNIILSRFEFKTIYSFYSRVLLFISLTNSRISELFSGFEF